MNPQDLFEILIREHADMLMTYLRSVVRDPGMADDLFQETTITAWRTIDRFDRTRPFGPWLRGIARMLVLSARRGVNRLPRLCDEETLLRIEDRMSEVQKLPGDTLDDKLIALRDCLDRLPETYRGAVDLRYQEELLPAEIVERLGVNAETVKKRLQRARCLLLECLGNKLSTLGT
ncbi:MAG: sigma-70 family RNA polymerase sigma factor [Planctomycetota bacterium]|nr:sigma-70 family RNA polymerase sigma factor [Planctomycetota bacterium]